MKRFVILSGCSGGGKSTLLAELGRRGFATVEEPGRRIIAEERAGSGNALPWVDLTAFARRAITLSLQDRLDARALPGTVFFDRGLVDAAAALEHETGEPALRTFAGERYNPLVFMTPPWPEIYAGDEDRKHGLTAAIAEYERLLLVYPSLGYSIEQLPKINVPDRADFVLQRLGLA